MADIARAVGCSVATVGVVIAEYERTTGELLQRSVDSRPSTLLARAGDVVRRIRAGRSVDGVARDLGVSRATIYSDIRRYQKLTGETVEAGAVRSSPTEKQHLGSRIRTLRRVAGLTQRDVEVRGGIATNLLTRVETGLVYPSARTLERIANVLGISVLDLLQSDQRTRDRVYLRAYHARTRPAPEPKPQDDPTLPPLGQMRYSEDGERVQCHACGAWKGSLVTHVRTHGHDASTYKEAYGLARTQSLLSRAAARRQSEAATARGQGQVGREVLRAIGPGVRPAGLDVRLASRLKYSEAGTGAVRPPPPPPPPKPVRLSATEVRDARERLGMTQAEFAASLGVHEETVGRYERGTLRCPRALTAAVAGLLIAWGLPLPSHQPETNSVNADQQ